jgi:hypothetical protein
MSVHQTWKDLYRMGGASFLISGISFIVGTILLVILGGPPPNGQAALSVTSGQELLGQTDLTVFLAADLFLMPAALALCVALSRVRKSYALIASGLAGLYIVIDVSVNEVNYFSLVALANQYSTATTDAQRAALVGAADLALAATNVGVPLVTLALSVGTLIFGVVMLRSPFGKGTAYLALLAGIGGIIGAVTISALAVVIVIWVILEGIWFVLVGVKLSRLE